MDADGFRSTKFRRLDDVRRVIQATTSAGSIMSAVREMARTDPLELASDTR